MSISAVWVYWAGGAESDEIRYSMRSVKKNFAELNNIVICGDAPTWYRGEHIDSPVFTPIQARRKYGTPKWAKWVDSIIKLQRIIDSPLVTDEFLWLYDDTFFLQDVTTEELSVPRSKGMLSNNLNEKKLPKWQEVLQRTAIALVQSGKPYRNFSHHGPIVYDKHKLQQTINKFDPMNRPRAIESLYMNDWFTNPTPLGNWLSYTQIPREGWTPNPQSKIVNVGSFNSPVQSFIKPKFSQAIDVEAGKDCVNRSALPTGTVICQLCGNKGKPVDIYDCSIYGKCTHRKYTARSQPERTCIGCDDGPWSCK